MKDSKAKKTLLDILFWIGVTAVFVVVVGGFNALFTGNQTTKMLNPLADAGMGYLADDWLANTKDPLPVFSWVVKNTYKYLDVRLFYVYQFILIGVFLYSLVNIADHFFKIKRNKLVYFLFLSVLMLSASTFWLGAVSEVLYNGVAAQQFGYDQFLPTAFAAFLFLSILLYLREKPYWAVAAIALACNFHTGYLIAGAALVAAYLLIDLWENRDLKRVFFIGGVALLMVLPIVLYYISSNTDATSAQSAEATKILVNTRIPHHTLVQVWWNDWVVVKVLVLLGAMLVSRRTKLFPILLVNFLIAAVPTALLSVRPSNTIAMLQLWRVSILAVPLATVTLIGALVSSLYQVEETQLKKWRWVWGVVLAGMVLAAFGFGIKTQLSRTGLWYLEPDEAELVTYVQETGVSGEEYMLPTKDIYSFRLLTGQPVVVNFKNHPYSSVEVLEWHKRLVRVNVFYGASEAKRCEFLPQLVADYGITHVVMPRSRPLDCEGAEKIYSNDGYWVYSVSP